MLNDQTIPVTFTGSLDTKSDEKTVMAGDLTALENGVFKAANQIAKRNGYDALPTAVTSGAGSIGPSDGMAVYKPLPAIEERIQFGNNRIYTYSPSVSAWVDKGDCYSLAESVRPISRSYDWQINPDSAVSGNIEVHAWYDNTTGKAVCTVLDNSSGAVHVSDFALGLAVSAPKVLAIGTTVYIFYPKAGNILAYRSLSTATPATIAAEVTLASNCSSAKPAFDIVYDGTNVWLAYNDATNIQLVKYSSALSSLATSSIAEVPTNALSIVVSTNVFVYWHNATNGTRYAVFSSALASILAATTIEATTSPTTFAITAYPISTTSQRVFYSVTGSTSMNALTKSAVVATSGVTTAASVLIRSISVTSKAFQVGGVTYFMGAFQSNLQSTYFCFRYDGLAVCKMLQTKAGGARLGISTAGPSLPQVNALTATKVMFSGCEITKIAAYNLVSSEVDQTKLGVDAITVDFLPSPRFRTANLGANLHITGGIISIYDGQGVVEQGFHVFPEGVQVGQGTGGNLADGIYQYAVVYEWIDAKGQTHRSAPSVPVQITISGGAGTAKVTVSIPTLRITRKTAPRQEVGIQIYRTLKNGSVFYNINQTLIPPTANDPTSDGVVVNDLSADALISGNEILYTGGGILENIAAPGCKIIDVYQSRMVIAGLEDPLQFWFSKTWQPLGGVAFNDSLTLRCDPFGGDITAVKLMDDKVILFKQNAIFYVSGDGPNDAGQGSTYGNPTLISSDVGCPYPNSLVLMPTGVMFKSNKGIYLLDRSLQVSYVGAKVEAYNFQNVTAATLRQDRNQVIFLTDSGSTLCYDYFFNKWSIFTNHTGVDAIVADGGKYHYLRTDGTVYEESTSFQDAGTNQYLKPVTAWLKLAGLQGFQRVRRFGILASYKSAHVLSVKVYYDYDDVNFDLYTFDAGANIGSTSVPYQFRGHLKRQKCEAIKFEIQDTSGGSVAEAYNISDLTLEVGVKGRINRLKASQSV